MHEESGDGRFDEHYAYFDQVRNTEKRNESEVGAICRMLNFDHKPRILDIPCGYGRLSVPLSKRGADVTGVDISTTFIEAARRAAYGAGVTPRFLVGDMRTYRPEHPFDAVVCWFGSFGYFSREENRQVLTRFADALPTGGRLILQVAATPGFFLGLSSEQSILVTTRREDDERLTVLEPDRSGGQVLGRDYSVVGGQMSMSQYSIQLFSAAEIEAELVKVGFIDTQLYGTGFRRYHWSDPQLTVTSY